MPTDELDQLMRSGQWQDAVVACQAALMSQPTSGKLRGILGLCFYRQNKLEEAIAEFQRAIILDPSYVDAAVKLAQAYDRLHRYEEAFAVAQEWLPKRPSDTTLRGIVETLRHQVRGPRNESWEQTRRLESKILLAEDERNA